jgi:hypothetical protein
MSGYLPTIRLIGKCASKESVIKKLINYKNKCLNQNKESIGKHL